MTYSDVLDATGDCTRTDKKQQLLLQMFFVLFLFEVCQILSASESCFVVLFYSVRQISKCVRISFCGNFYSGTNSGTESLCRCFFFSFFFVLEMCLDVDEADAE
jgi:hypothetical protein